jgi:vacuolar protein-sorting-associated protein 4
MSYVDFVTPAVEHAKIAAQQDESKEYDQAYKSYMKAIEFFMTAVKHEKVPKKKEMLRTKCNELLERAEKIKEYLDQNNTGGGGGGGTSANVGQKVKKDKTKDDEEDKQKLRGTLEGAIVKEKPNVRWDDVAGLDGAKEALKEAVIMPIRFPQLFTGTRKPWKGILLYGPPGTGKSFLAKAVATESNATFFSVSSADLMSKWLGESEKLVRNLFEMARESAPSIIFIDEIDSMCSARGDGDSDSTRRVKTEFLVQMQGVGNDREQRVLVLAATNMPWTLDPGIRRRFERRVYISLPEAGARKAMFNIHIGSTPHALTPADFDDLSQQTKGYSGSDINIVVRTALMEAIRTVQTATHFRKRRGPLPMDPNTIVDDLMEPCDPSDPDAIRVSLKEFPANRVVPPPVTALDFFKALRTTRPTVSEDDLLQHVKFTQDYGQEG